MVLDANDRRWISDVMSIVSLGLFLALTILLTLVGWRLNSLENRIQGSMEQIIELRRLDAQIIEQKVQDFRDDQSRQNELIRLDTSIIEHKVESLIQEKDRH